LKEKQSYPQDFHENEKETDIVSGEMTEREHQKGKAGRVGERSF
jgi:hypothetical protein